MINAASNWEGAYFGLQTLCLNKNMKMPSSSCHEEEGGKNPIQSSMSCLLNQCHESWGN